MKKYLAGLISTLVFLAIVLVSAGRLTFWPAWVYAAISVMMNVAMRWTLRHDPDLEQERSKPGPGAQEWDKKLLGLGLLLTLAMLIVAGLDSGRFHWYPHLPWVWSFAGAFLSLAGMGIFLSALKENRYFSAVVRIQRDRGQTVCRSGIYRVVRHPGNAGMIIGTLGFPLLFTSAWSAIPALLSAALMVVRTQREDRLLEQELDGYRDYQIATRYRLLPGVW